jgi:hypothetical protein
MGPRFTIGLAAVLACSAGSLVAQQPADSLRGATGHARAERGPGPSQPSEEHVHPDSGARAQEAPR